MKYLVMILTLTVSMIVYGQDAEDLVVRSVPEDSMVYLKTGQTVGRFPDPQEVTMNAFGYLRYAEQFIYGIEYNSFYSRDIETRASSVQGVLGYRVIWNKRFLPYGVFQFGHADLKDESGQGRYSGNGLAVTGDIGVDVIKIWKIKGSFGIRHSIYNFNNKTLPNASFTDMYIMTGIVF